MGFTQPNDGGGTYTEQEYGFGQEWEEIAASAGVLPLKCVIDGAAPTDGASGLQVDVAAGVLWYNGKPYYEAAATVTATTADGSNPRIDYVVYDQSAAAYQFVTGTAAASPNPPTLTADQVLIAEVYVPAAATTLAAANIIDKRVVSYTPASTEVWYVDTDNGTDPGASTWAGWGKEWRFAYSTIALAVADAAVGDTIRVRGAFSTYVLTKQVQIVGEDQVNSSAFARTISAAATLDWRHGVVKVTGATTITLPDADDYEGRSFFIQRDDASNNVTVQPGTFDIVKDGTTYTGTAVLADDGAAIGIYSDGTDWIVSGDRGTVTYT